MIMVNPVRATLNISGLNLTPEFSEMIEWEVKDALTKMLFVQLAGEHEPEVAHQLALAATINVKVSQNGAQT